MKWKEEKDVILLTTMAGEGCLSGNMTQERERGSAWDLKAESLHCQKEFIVNTRSI